MEKQVSVIIPVYNAEKYLTECLESVLHQSFQDIQVVLVDDGSKDASASIIREYMEKYPACIKGIFQENRGQSSARNAALEAAKGKYVVFLDSDDFLGEHYIEALYKAAEDADSDMVICNYTKVQEDGQIIKAYQANYCEGDFRIPSYLSCNRIIRRQVLEDYGIRYKEGVICEDISFVLELEAVARNIQLIPMAEYYYRTNFQSTTMTLRKKKLKMEQLPFQAMEECIAFCKEHDPQYKEEWMEFLVCRIWTTLLFDVGLGCEKEVRKGMCREVLQFMQRHFPRYYKNPYIKPGAFSNLPKEQKWGPWLFVHAAHCHMLSLFVVCCSYVMRGSVR